VAAFICLADIFMLRAKNLNGVAQGYGWTDDELLKYAETGVFPERIAINHCSLQGSKPP
jgi:hypothetical protein